MYSPDRAITESPPPARAAGTRRLPAGLLCLLAGIALLAAWALRAYTASPSHLPRVGYVMLGSVIWPSGEPNPLLEHFRRGLRELGYIEGQNMVLEIRSADWQAARYPALVAELVTLPVDVIVAGDSLVTPFIMQATDKIPIILTTNGDPVGNRLVASLAHPGGNVTGLSIMNPVLDAKRLQLLATIAPGITRPAVLWNGSHLETKAQAQALQAEATNVGMEAISLEVSRSEDLDQAFQTAIEERADAFLVIPDVLINSNRSRIAEFALAQRLPSIFHDRTFVDDGGLMSYGPDRNYNYWRAATYVDKILNGAHPGDIPVEQPNRFQLVINQITAQALGLDIPQTLHLMATDEIR